MPFTYSLCPHFRYLLLITLLYIRLCYLYITSSPRSLIINSILISVNLFIIRSLSLLHIHLRFKSSKAFCFILITKPYALLELENSRYDLLSNEDAFHDGFLFKISSSETDTKEFVTQVRNYIKKIGPGNSSLMAYKNTVL